ncbi:DUF4382 domain-containing protein [Sunxiuqinia sp. A32]|uniref:DUF4382 domain-containing protein n=1 Tax=Sunxiuqinia sp. A32 TaxID=3461496 RepID=UPI0040452D6A
MKRLKLTLCIVVISAFTFVSCNKDNSGGTGQLNVLLTDAPFPIELVSKTIVTIDRIDIKKQESDTTEASFIVLSEEEMEIDLLQLSNGITELLASSELEAGAYDMIRLHIVEASVVLTDDTDFNLTVPSGASSGLKIKLQPSIKITDGQTADALLDFDVSKSFVVKGSVINGSVSGFNFKPVVRAVNLGIAGRIEGNVTDIAETPLENALVKVWLPVEAEEDSLVTSSFSDVDGNYKAVGLLEGSYYLTIDLEGYTSLTIIGVNVVAGGSTLVDFDLQATE